MAILTRYWRLDSTTGGDGTVNATTGSTRAYESLSALIAAEATDLDAANDILHAICTEPGREVPSSTRTLGGFTTSAADYIIIECQGDAHHKGISREKSGTGYQMQRPGDGMRGTTDYYRFIGFEASTTGSGYNAFEDATGGGSSTDRRFNECLFTTTRTTAWAGYICFTSGAAVYSYTNCLTIANKSRGWDNRGNTSCTMDHCGLISAGSYGIMVDSDSDVKNTYALEQSSEDWYQTAGTASNNASVDGSATGADEVVILDGNDEFATYSELPSTCDASLIADSLLIGAGTGSEAIDITGAARTGTADIGPFNYDAGGGNDITATAPLTFGSDATLNATGDLVAAAALAFASSADMKAAGELTGSAALIFGSSAVLNASGDMVAVDAMGFASSADLNAPGEMAAAATVTFGSAADLTPAETNELIAAAALAWTSSADLSAFGSLVTTATVIFGSSADLVDPSSDDITASAVIVWGSSAALKGTGSLVAVATVTFGSSAALGSIGSLVASSSLAWGSSAALAAAAAGFGGVWNAAAYFATGSTVTISLADPITGAVIATDIDSCSEIGSTGVFVWDSDNLTTAPIDYQEYLWRMTDSTNFEGGVIRINAMSVSDLMAHVMENGETYAEQIRLIRADAAGSVVQAADGTYGIRDAADSKDRITSGPGANNGRDVTATDGA